MLEIDVEIYETSNGKRPFEEWIKDIREVHTRAKILTRIDRLKWGLQNPSRWSIRTENSLWARDTDLLWKDWK